MHYRVQVVCRDGVERVQRVWTDGAASAVRKAVLETRRRAGPGGRPERVTAMWARPGLAAAGAEVEADREVGDMERLAAAGQAGMGVVASSAWGGVMEPLAGLNGRLVCPLTDEARAYLCEEVAVAVESNPHFSMWTCAWVQPRDGEERYRHCLRVWSKLGREPAGYPGRRTPSDMAGTLVGYLYGVQWICTHPDWQVGARAREVLGLPLHEANALLHPNGEDEGHEADHAARIGDPGGIDRAAAAAMLRLHGRTGATRWPRGEDGTGRQEPGAGKRRAA